MFSLTCSSMSVHTNSAFLKCAPKISNPSHFETRLVYSCPLMSRDMRRKNLQNSGLQMVLLDDIHLPLVSIVERVRSLQTWSGKTVRNDKLICIRRQHFTNVSTLSYMSAVMLTSGEIYRKWNYNRKFVTFTWEMFGLPHSFPLGKLCLHEYNK